MCRKPNDSGTEYGVYPIADWQTGKCSVGSDVPKGNRAGLGLMSSYNIAGDLTKLFSKSYGVWALNGDSYSSPSCGEGATSAPCWDIRGSTQGSLGTTGGVGVPAAPRVKAVCFNNAGEPIECSGSGFTIRTEAGSVISQEARDVDILSGSAVSVLFYAYNPNGEQMPLREIKVDWVGNQNPNDMAGAEGKYKNRKHVCLASTDPNYTFGDGPNACIADTTQQPAYFVFTRVYTCSIGGPGYDAVKGYCEFNPKVYVEDNWEWCIGSDGTGAWGNSCRVTEPNAWLPFGGKIIVRP